MVILSHRTLAYITLANNTLQSRAAYNLSPRAIIMYYSPKSDNFNGTPEANARRDEPAAVRSLSIRRRGYVGFPIRFIRRERFFSISKNISRYIIQIDLKFFRYLRKIVFFVYILRVLSPLTTSRCTRGGKMSSEKRNMQL